MEKSIPSKRLVILVFKLLRTWTEPTLSIVQGYTERTQGSSIEIKESSIVWHFSHCSRDFGEMQSKELVAQLHCVLFKFVLEKKVEITYNPHYIEIKPKDKDKGTLIKTILRHVRKHRGPVDFILCIGDDTTDEDMFKFINSEAKVLKSDLQMHHYVKYKKNRIDS